jgi:hypothetical protein
MSTVVDTYVDKLEDSTRPIRLGWAVLVPVKLGELWHLFQPTALLANTNGTIDDVVKRSILEELFRHESSVLSGEKFDNPFPFAQHPLRASTFLTARAVGVTPLNAGIGAAGISRGINYGNNKARKVVKLAKQLIAFKNWEL